MYEWAEPPLMTHLTPCGAGMDGSEVRGVWVKLFPAGVLRVLTCSVCRVPWEAAHTDA